MYLFPIGKSFWKKQTKTIKGQGEKQIKAIQKLRQIKTIKKYAYDDKDSSLISKQKELFNKLADERLEEITELDNKGGKVSLADKKNDQIKFKSDVSKIKKQNKKNKSKEQKSLCIILKYFTK